MGEAIISRGGAKQEQSIPILPGYHSALVTVKRNNTPVPGVRLSCRDGSVWYNYTTNNDGQCLFMCNSGSANIYMYNTISGFQYLDFKQMSKNIDAVIGTSSKTEFIMEDGLNEFTFTTNNNFALFRDLRCDIIMIGGGGGKAKMDDSGDWIGSGGGGGGGGYINKANKIFNKGNYSLVIGTGGTAGTPTSTQGGSGGTTILKYESNGIMSANGGTGGMVSSNGSGETNGGYQGQDGESSTEIYGGGGGGGARRFQYGPYSNGGNGGKPYGGNGGSFNNVIKAENGTNGGGGGGAGGNFGVAGRGGNGVCKLKIFYN